MTLKEHRKIHVELHRALDHLIGEWITCTKFLPKQHTIFELMEWSYYQTLYPSDTSDERNIETLKRRNKQ